MQADKQAPLEPNAIYQTPQVIELGDAVALTNGTGADDTADMRRYYF